MPVIKFTGSLCVNQKAGKTLGQEVPLYGPGVDAKSLVALEMCSKATWRIIQHERHLQLLQGTILWSML